MPRLHPSLKFRHTILATVYLGCGIAAAASVAASSGILKQIDVAPIWSVHRCGSPELLTRDGRQYVAYYDEDRFLTIASRELEVDQWNYQRFPVQMGWQTGAHAKLSMALDRDGHIHLSCYRRQLLQAPGSPPMALYYRSTAPHSINEFDRLYMVTPEEHPHYPTYHSIGGTLLFNYRDGTSGRGNQLLNRYDNERRIWLRAINSPLLDGRGERSAYVHAPGPLPGPDGRFHLLWLWRDTPDHATNHSLSYARTIGDDLTQWESAAGVPVTPPFDANHRELLVDDTPPGGGLSNALFHINWDSKNRPIVSFHKFDENGVSQIYNARFINGGWRSVQATEWKFIWGDTYSGSGALGIHDEVRFGRVEPGEAGELTQQVWNRHDKGALIVLDEETLIPNSVGSPRAAPQWHQTLMKPESDFQVPPIPDLRRAGGPMQVNLIRDKGDSGIEGVEYYLRWEHAGTNRDREVPKPWPEPTMLRVYQIRIHN